MRFSVFDNLVLMHCLPLGTAAVYDFLLPPDVPSDGSNLPLFRPLLVITGAPRAVPESTILEPTDEQSVKQLPSPSSSTAAPSEGSATARSDTANASGAAASSGTNLVDGAADTDQATVPAASAVFLPPCHAVDIEKRVIYRCDYWYLYWNRSQLGCLLRSVCLHSSRCLRVVLWVTQPGLRCARFSVARFSSMRLTVQAASELESLPKRHEGAWQQPVPLLV